MEIKIQLSDDEKNALQELVGKMGCETIEDVVLFLAQSAAAGVLRPGAWESGWVEQCFGD